MKVTLIQATPNPIETISKIASICYDSDPKNPAGLVKHLYRNGHHSVMEHIYFTFKIEGISRACSHQLVRHRHCSFTQRSQRYCSEDGFETVEPRSISQIDKKNGYTNGTRRTRKRMTKDKPYYTDYVRHAMRFYSRHLDRTQFKNNVDKSNWMACHNVIKAYTDRDKNILTYVYGSFDTLGDNVYAMSNKYQIHQNIIWDTMRDFERKVAIER